MKNKKKLATFIVVLAILGGGIWFFINGAYAGGASAPYVSSYVVGRNTLKSTITAQGEVSLLQFTVASIENTLEVEEILVNQNDDVVKGQRLIRFNTNMIDRQREYERLQNQLRDTQLARDAQTTQLNSMRLGPTTLELENAAITVRRAVQAYEDAVFALNQFETNLALQERELAPLNLNLQTANLNVISTEAGVTNAQIALNTAETTLTNTRILYDAGGVTRNQLEQAETAVLSAQIALDNALRGVEQASSSITDLETRISITEDSLTVSANTRYQMQRNIEAARDNIQIAEISLEDLRNRANSPQNQNAIRQQQIAIQRTTLAIEEIQRNMRILNDVEEYLYSPVGGTITAINTSAGALASARVPLIHISDAEDYVMRAFVNERHAGSLAMFQQVLIEGSILADTHLYGHISSIGAIATTTQIGGVLERVVPIEISVLDADVLIPGVALDITITTEILEDVISIPILSTLLGSNNEPFVFVINDDNTLSVRYVEIVSYANMYIKVEGLLEGERIVLQPQHTMFDSMVVNPL